MTEQEFWDDQREYVKTLKTRKEMEIYTNSKGKRFYTFWKKEEMKIPTRQKDIFEYATVHLFQVKYVDF